MIANSSPVIATGPAEHEAPAEAITQRSWALPRQRLALGLILLLAATLNVWRLDRLGYGNS